MLKHIEGGVSVALRIIGSLLLQTHVGWRAGNALQKHPAKLR